MDPGPVPPVTGAHTSGGDAYLHCDAYDRPVPSSPWYGGREGQFSRFYFDMILLRLDFHVVEFCSASIFDKSRRNSSVPLRF